MSLKDISIKHSYISYGKEGISSSLISPALKEARLYRRSVGFFSSGALVVLVDGISSLVRNHGKIQLIASPNLTDTDVNTIKKGYDARERLLHYAFEVNFLEAVNDLDDDRLKILYELVSKGYMDIKIAITKSVGMYHDKLGIVEDYDGNAIAFYGSANASYNGYCENYEKVRVVRSWIEGEKDSVIDEIKEFNTLWNNANSFVEVYSFTESAKKNLLHVMEKRSNQGGKAGIKLRDYQKEAIAAWVNNNYHGFYVMATGTGKTWTAIYSAVELLKAKKTVLTVICAPYKHLVKQWAEDVEKTFPNAKIIMVSSENVNWEAQMSQSIIKQKYNPEMQIIVITTISSFYLKRFITTLMKSYTICKKDIYKSRL